MGDRERGKENEMDRRRVVRVLWMAGLHTCKRVLLFLRFIFVFRVFLTLK